MIIEFSLYFSDIASKEISLNEAIEGKMFNVYGDVEIWKNQLEALKKILPNMTFPTRKEKLKEVEKIENLKVREEWTDYSNLPQMDLSDVPKEFESLRVHFESLRKKYNVTKQNELK